MNIDELEGLDEETRKKIEELQKVTRERYGDTYFAKAQYSIGMALMDKGFLDEAISELMKVNKNDSAEGYVLSQEYIGDILKKQNKVDQAIDTWKSIKKDHDSKVYLRANYKIGEALIERDNVEEAILYWEAIDENDHPNLYPTIQLLIGRFLIRKNKIKEAIHALSKITEKQNPEKYAEAQITIGKQLIITDKSNENIAKARISFSNAEKYFPYETYCYKKICNVMEIIETKSFGLNTFKLLNLVLDIVSILTLDFSKYADEEKPFERKLAHYTSTYTSNLLIGDNKTKRSPSFFRLNTINNVNDPSEGQLLVRKLKEVKSNEFYPLDFNERFHAFISCFTFNHDSLNQFRLYGKENDKEASGMSLVFRKDFFKSKNFIGGISHLSIGEDRSENISDSNKNNVNLHSVKIEDEERSKEVLKRSVMRCVYLDPTSEYFHLAQRNRLTFYREFGDKVIMINGNKRPQAEYEWELYEKYIGNITSKFKKAYDTLKVIYKEVEQETNNIRVNFDVSKAKELSEFTEEILLPLKYLIKHSAFREEQECRMIYITSVDKPEVTMEYGSFLYVEYKTSVKDHLDKIYIAPAALQHKRYFDNILKDVDVPVEISGNVFR